MGLFSAGSTTVVSSSIYNMAGDINKRPDFLKSTVTANLIGGSSQSMTDMLQSAYQNGPGMSLRSFARWAEGSSGYNDTIGFVQGSLVTGNSLNTDTLAEQIRLAIGAPGGYTIGIESSDIGYGDISWWAEQYILAHAPTLIGTNWHCDYVNGQAVITYADGSKQSFTPSGFNADAKFIFASYTLNSGEVAGSVVLGSQVNLAASTAFPDTSGWTLVSNTMTPVTLTLSSVTTQGMNTNTVFQKTTYKGIDPANPARAYSTRQIMTQVQTMTVSGGNPVTTRWYRIDTQDITNLTRSGLQIFIYSLGSGNATLDAMFNPPADMGKFFPYIPVRIDNNMLSDTYQPDVYAKARRAYKKATGKRFSELVDKMNENESIGDIDYAYVVFGVSANTKEVSAKKYIWAFFESIMDSASFPRHAYSQFQSQWADAAAAQTKYNEWVASQGATNSVFGNYTQDAPKPGQYPTLPRQSIEMKTSERTNLNFNMLISWNGIESRFGAGLADPAHKAGDIWWVINGADTFVQDIRTTQDPLTATLPQSYQIPHVTLYWQVDGNNWKALDLYGLKHQNFIYDGKSVDIGITDAINDTEESGFIIPLNEEIFRSMPIKDATQMATACIYVVFNCYQVVKKKWYQSWWFSVVMIIIIIIITWFTWGTGTGPAMSAYGAIGAAIGLTGTAAIIAGMVITMVAMMIIMKLISMAATAIFGAKTGAIVTAIAAVVLIVVGAGYSNGGDWTAAMSSLTEPQNLMALTSAVGSGVTQYMAAEAQDLLKQTNDMLAQYNTEMASVSDKYGQVIGDHLAYFNPMELTDSSTPAVTGGKYVYEPADTFLNRTLMTGSDIAELNSALISQFTSLTLDLNQNLAT